LSQKSDPPEIGRYKPDLFSSKLKKGFGDEGKKMCCVSAIELPMNMNKHK
jgi:hypothetical protein